MSALTYQGKPCAHGHDGTRYASNRKCIACARRTDVYIVLTSGLDAHRSLPMLPPPWCTTEAAALSLKGVMFSVHRERDSAERTAQRIKGEVWRAVRIK